MSLTTFLVRRYVTHRVREQLRHEYDAWRSSDVPPLDYVRERVPAAAELVTESPLLDLARRLRDDSTTPARLRAQRASAAEHHGRAGTLTEVAEAAQRRVDELEAAITELPDRRAAVDDIRTEAEQRVTELTDQARAETDRRVDVARKRLQEIEDRAALHVEEVQRQARLAANAIVSRAEATYAREETTLLADLDQARVDARVATERAEEALERASATSSGVADAAAELGDAVPGRARSRLLGQFVDAASRRAERAEAASRRLRASVDVHDLDDLDRPALYQRARELDIPGRSKMSRAELIDALRDAAS